MSEAVYLKKPMLSVPIGGQFEQVLNALYLQKLNYGMHATALDGKVLGEFLERVDGCAKSLANFSQDGNTVLLDKLDSLLAEAHGRKGQWDETTVS
jgi:UDP-N-acetylglucosamine:LPS N-acetylglucosamine transferase